MARITVAQAGGLNRLGFLDLIPWSELGEALIAVGDSGYNVLVGSTAEKPILFHDYSRHPRILNHQFDSTAAGAYQAIFPTWRESSTKLQLLDFGPESQDLFAIERLRVRNALGAIDAGNIAVAIMLCANEWASFPGNSYGQHEQTLADLIAAYTAARQKYLGA